MEAIAAAVFIALTGREVVAKFAGSICAVRHELRTECVIHISTGISHDTGAWCEYCAHVKSLFRKVTPLVKRQRISHLLYYCTC